MYGMFKIDFIYIYILAWINGKCIGRYILYIEHLGIVQHNGMGLGESSQMSVWSNEVR